jgi:hypothetical protein
MPAIEVKVTTGQFIDPGLHVSKCCLVSGIGSHPNFQGTASVRKLVLGFELFDEDGEAIGVLSKICTENLGDLSTLGMAARALLGPQFPEVGSLNVETLLGCYCYIEVSEKTKDGKNVSEIKLFTPLPKAYKTDNLKPERTEVYFNFNSDFFDIQQFENLDSWIKKMVEESEEYKKLNSDEKSN